MVDENMRLFEQISKQADFILSREAQMSERVTRLEANYQESKKVGNTLI